MIRRLLPLSLVLLLGGCLSLGGPATEVQVYAPAVRVAADPAWPAVDWSLSIGTPQANSLVDSQRIAVRPTPDRLQAYKGARWADTGPDMVQTALVQAFEDSGRITAVSRFGGGGSRGEYALVSELRAFETIYEGGQPRVVVDLQVRLLGRGGVVAARRFRQEAAPATAQVEDVVAAFGDALAGVSGEVVGWALAEGERARAAAAAEAR